MAKVFDSPYLMDVLPKLNFALIWLLAQLILQEQQMTYLKEDFTCGNILNLQHKVIKVEPVKQQR